MAGIARIEKSRHWPSCRRTRCSNRKGLRSATASFQAEALILLVGLTGQGRPAGLLAHHPPGGVVGPDHTLDRIDGGLKACHAFVQSVLGFLALGLVGHDADDAGGLSVGI
jgi:hypothetical protein